MRLAKCRRTGFTLVELVVVILLLSILSVYAVSRYSGASGFSAYAAQQQAITVIRQIQLSRMQSNVSTVSSNYQLSVSDSCLGSVASCATTEARSNRLELPDNIRFSQTMTVGFDLLGNPVCLSTACPTDYKIEIVSSADTLAVCINNQGYVYGC